MNDADPPRTAYQLKITLDHVKPPVWRRVLVASDMTLYDLHRVLQIVMPWEGGHMWAFDNRDRRRPVRYEMVSGDDEDELGFGFDEDVYDSEAEFLESLSESVRPHADELMRNFNAMTFTVTDALPNPKAKLRYEYDFGDNWHHAIVLEKIIAAPEDTLLPVCLAGVRACPPEDCGGSSGYMEFLRALSDPEVAAKDADFEETREWYGADFDPEVFDLHAVNKRLRVAFRPKAKRKPAARRKPAAPKRGWVFTGTPAPAEP